MSASAVRAFNPPTSSRGSGPQDAAPNHQCPC